MGVIVFNAESRRTGSGIARWFRRGGLVLALVIGLGVNTGAAEARNAVQRRAAGLQGAVLPAGVLHAIRLSTAHRLARTMAALRPGAAAAQFRPVQQAARAAADALRHEDFDGAAAAVQAAQRAYAAAPLQAGIVSQCLFEWLSIFGSLWDYGLGQLINGEPGSSCYNLATTEDLLLIVESLMAYTVCAMRYAEEPDEEAIDRLEIARKSVLVVYEFLYLVDLLSCYGSDDET